MAEQFKLVTNAQERKIFKTNAIAIKIISVPTTFHGGIVSKLPTRTWNKAKISPHIPLKTALITHKWRILWSNLVTHTAWLDAEGFFGLLRSCGSSWTRTRNCSVVLVQHRQWPPRLRSFWSLKLHFDSYIMGHHVISEYIKLINYDHLSHHTLILTKTGLIRTRKSKSNIVTLNKGVFVALNFYITASKAHRQSLTTVLDYKWSRERKWHKLSALTDCKLRLTNLIKF